jgi:hypothetical protein
VAWAAGLFEGEGSVIHWQRSEEPGRRPGGKVRGLALKMTDRDVVERFARITGCGSVTVQERRNQRDSRRFDKTLYVWQARNWQEIEPVLRLMVPYMGIRRRAKMESLLADPPTTGRYRTHCVKHPEEELRAVFPSDLDEVGHVRHRRCPLCVEQNQEAAKLRYRRKHGSRGWLTDEEVAQVRARAAAGDRKTAIASDVGISRSGVYAILAGRYRAVAGMDS